MAKRRVKERRKRALEFKRLVPDPRRPGKAARGAIA